MVLKLPIVITNFIIPGHVSLQIKQRLTKLKYQYKIIVRDKPVKQS